MVICFCIATFPVLVSGSLTLVSSFLGFLTYLTLLGLVKKKLSGLVVFMELAFVTWFQAILGFASLIWFIVGSVYVFK